MLQADFMGKTGVTFLLQTCYNMLQADFMGFVAQQLSGVTHASDDFMGVTGCVTKCVTEAFFSETEMVGEW